MTLEKPKFKKVKSLFGKYEEIPIDWEIKTFDELFKFLRTGTNSRDDLEKSGDIQYIHCIDKAKVQELPFLGKNYEIRIIHARNSVNDKIELENDEFVVTLSFQ